MMIPEKGDKQLSISHCRPTLSTVAMESILVAFRGLSATSDRISVILDLLNELDIEERLQWQESANSFFHRDFIGFLPPELACKVLDMLDAPTLLRCCQVHVPIFMIRVMQP